MFLLIKNSIKFNKINKYKIKNNQIIFIKILQSKNTYKNNNNNQQKIKIYQNNKFQ